MLTGPDVSHHQGTVDMERVRSTGHSFVGIKATEGVGYTDPQFGPNRDHATSAGLVRLLYHFARPSKNAPNLEADWFLRVVGSLHPGEIPVLDIEDEHATGDLSEWALTWLDRVAAGTARIPILYTYRPFAKAHLYDARLARFPLWLAAYNATPPAPPLPWKGWAIWQHTSDGSCPGITGRCDLNRSEADIVALAASPTPHPSDARQEDLLMAAALDDTDARRCLIRWWFREYLGRGFQPFTVDGKQYTGTDEQNLHLYVFATKGADICLGGILDSEEAKSRARAA